MLAERRCTNGHVLPVREITLRARTFRGRARKGTEFAVLHGWGFCRICNPHLVPHPDGRDLQAAELTTREEQVTPA